jgi:hypothetical protein
LLQAGVGGSMPHSHNYSTPRSGSAKNNSKNRCRNFREFFFQKNIFVR